MPAGAASTIGQLNGAWAWMLRLALVLVPLLATGGTWMAVEVVSIKASRFTNEDGREMYTRMAELDKAIVVGSAPLERRIDEMNTRLVRMEERQTMVLETLERLEP